MKHCITYRYGYLTGRCLLCTDVKKLTLIYTSGTNSQCIFSHLFVAQVHMNCLTGDLIKGFLRAYGTKYRSCHFCIKDAYFWSFSACAQKGSMLTLASDSRVAISTGTLGTVMCWGLFLILLRASLQGISPTGIQKGLIALFFSGIWVGEEKRP